MLFYLIDSLSARTVFGRKNRPTTISELKEKTYLQLALAHEIGIQMKRKDLIETFMMI